MIKIATEYTITYTYTGQSNTSATRSVAFSKFTASGDTDRNIGQITSIQYVHYHTSAGSMSWGLRGRLVLDDGTTFVSNQIYIGIDGEVVKYTNTFSNLPTAEQFAAISSVQTLDTKGKTTSGGYSSTLYWRANSTYPMKLIVKFIEEPPVTYAPFIETFDVYRVDENSMLDDEAQYVATTLKLSIGNESGLDTAQCRIYYAANSYPEVGVSQYVDLTSKISDLLSGVSLNTEILTGVWGIGYTWNFALVFIAGEETALSTAFIGRGTVSMHISNEPGGGVAIGGFSTGTSEDPKFESYFPAHLSGGIASIGSGLCLSSRKALGIQAGHVSFTSIGGGTYSDKTVTFETPFAEGTTPIVVVGFEVSSTAASHGQIACSAHSESNTKVVIRILNGSSSTRSPGVNWIAVGEIE